MGIPYICNSISSCALPSHKYVLSANCKQEERCEAFVCAQTLDTGTAASEIRLKGLDSCLQSIVAHRNRTFRWDGLLGYRAVSL